MSEEVKNFIDKMAQNDMVGAGDAFKAVSYTHLTLPTTVRV